MEQVKGRGSVCHKASTEVLYQVRLLVVGQTEQLQIRRAEDKLNTEIPLAEPLLPLEFTLLIFIPWENH